jgi:hypothetical protein
MSNNNGRHGIQDCERGGELQILQYLQFQLVDTKTVMSNVMLQATSVMLQATPVVTSGGDE